MAPRALFDVLHHQATPELDQGQSSLFFLFFFKFIYLFIYGYVGVGFSLVAVSGGYSSLWHAGSVVVARGL